MDGLTARKLQKQNYHLIGKNTAVKLCHWTKQSLTSERACYKSSFYGINSHQCIQMTPVVNSCNHSCIYCWRGQEWETSIDPDSIDDPEQMADEIVKAQRQLMTGYGGDDRTLANRFEEAQAPAHVAISLAGEPTMYPRLGEFLDACHRRNLSTFLVTNGSSPEVIEALDPLPTQLYLSVDAPTENLFLQLCRPTYRDAWERLLETIDLMASLECRTVIRHTLIKGAGLDQWEDYAALDNRGDPTFIEAKGFSFVGGARQRMSIQNMPTFAEVMHFSRELAPLVGRSVLDYREDSRVVLIGREKKRLPVLN